MPRGRRRRVPFPPEPPGDRISFDEARRRREVARALLAELQVARTKNELLEYAQRWVADRAAAVRDAVLRIPDRYAALGAARLGVGEEALWTWLDEVLHEFLTELADLPPRLNLRVEEVGAAEPAP